MARLGDSRAGSLRTFCLPRTLGFGHLFTLGANELFWWTCTATSVRGTAPGRGCSVSELSQLLDNGEVFSAGRNEARRVSASA
jgi:hypothetical protein